MSKPCALCGFPEQEKPPFHYPYCTPALRALVKAAATWYRQASNPTRSIYEARLCRAVARFRAERKERKP